MTPSNTSKYKTVPGWSDYTHMGRTSIYEALARGDLRAIKVGRRTLIDVEHGLAWLASQPTANIRTGQAKTAA